MDNYQIRQLGEAITDAVIDSLDSYSLGCALEQHFEDFLEENLESKMEEKLDEYVSGLQDHIDAISNAVDQARELICALEDVESAVDTLKGEMGL